MFPITTKQSACLMTIPLSSTIIPESVTTDADCPGGLT